MAGQQRCTGTHMGPDRDRAIWGHIRPAVAMQTWAAPHPSATGRATVRSPSQKIWLQALRRMPIFPGQEEDCHHPWHRSPSEPFLLPQGRLGQFSPSMWVLALALTLKEAAKVHTAWLGALGWPVLGVSASGMDGMGSVMSTVPQNGARALAGHSMGWREQHRTYLIHLEKKD